MNDATFDQLHSVFIEQPVLMLPDQRRMRAEQRFAFGRCFGAPKTDTSPDGHPEILSLSNLKKDANDVGTLQRRVFRHIDRFFGKLPTGAAYETRPKGLSGRAAGLANKVRRAKSWPIIRTPTPEPVAACAGAFNPPARTHQGTGSKSLFRATTRRAPLKGCIGRRAARCCGNCVISRPVGSPRVASAGKKATCRSWAIAERSTWQPVLAGRRASAEFASRPPSTIWCRSDGNPGSECAGPPKSPAGSCRCGGRIPSSCGHRRRR